jgi:hypothetical protein
MKTNSDPERDDALLDATLNDSAWQEASAAFKAQALKTFRAQQRLRLLGRWGTGAAALAALVVGLAGAPASCSAPNHRAPVQVAAVAQAPEKPRQPTDDELLATFPKGSCFLAEVDGKKELVFLDPKVERAFVSPRGAQR